MSRYANSTKVSTQKSRAEIESTLMRYGADGFCYLTQGSRALIQFTKDKRIIQFELTLPDPSEFARTPVRGDWRTPEAKIQAWEQSCRQRWRALALMVKAKLEAVESGITTFETEFMPHILLPHGKTVAQELLPRIDEAIEKGTIGGQLLPQLTDGSS